MALNVGTRLGHCDVTALLGDLGEDGMGKSGRPPTRRSTAWVACLTLPSF